MAEQEKGNLSLEDRRTDFPQLLQELDGGVIANVLGLAASKIAQAATVSDKKGEIKANFSIKPYGSNNDMVEITATMNFNEPKSGYGNIKEDFQYVAIAHVGRGGKLTYDKPRENVNGQTSLPGLHQLKEVRG